MNEISQRLYALMEERGTNARRVASDLNLSNSSFTDWKDSKNGPGLKALMKLAPYFKVSLDYLITGKESECASLAEAREREREFCEKLSALPAFCQGKVSGYMDALLEMFPADTAERRKMGRHRSGNTADFQRSEAHV